MTIELIRQEIRDLLPYKIDEARCPVKLDANENPYPLPQELHQKVSEAIDAVLINRYPDPFAGELKAEISGRLSIPEKYLMIGNGSDELIQAILISTSWGSPTIIIPAPTFSMYKITGLAVGHRIVEVPLDENFDIDADAIINACHKERAKVVFLSSPNNPTGNRFTDEKVMRVVKESNALVVVDEAYGDFCGKTMIPYLKDNINLIILRTLSKIGMAGLRLGIMAANPDLLVELDKVRLPYNINSLSQAAATVILRDMEVINNQIDAIIEDRSAIYEQLKKMTGIVPYHSDANFILFKAPNADRLHQDLIAEGVLIRNLNRPGRLENCMRVTIGNPDENHAFLASMKKLLKAV